jgi:hypothetical protein
MSLPITIPNTFATETTNIPLSDLDANFTTVADGVNGIGNGTNALANVAVTGGSIANVAISGVTATGVTANVVSISNATITGGSITGITPIAVVAGGTGANSAATARTNLSAAASGANSDITSLTGLTTALSVAQGGTGSANLTANSVVIGNGVSAVSGVAPGTSGNLLTSNGTAWTSAASSAIGVGQTWQDVTASRSTGTTYTNSTGRPIQVNVVMGTYTDAAVYMTLTVDGLPVAKYGYGRAGAGSNGNGICTAIIPAGSTYVMTGTWTNWYELR